LITEITKIFTHFEDGEYCKIFDNEDFGYTKVTVERPLVENGKVVKDKNGKPKPDSSLRDYEKGYTKIMIEQKEEYKAVTGKTYTLFGDDVSTDRYYSTIRNIADNLLHVCSDKEKLLLHIQGAGVRRQLFKKSTGIIDLTLISLIRKNVHETLSAYTSGVEEHLRSLSLSQRVDETLRTKEKQYHLYMLEIELVNRIYKESFKKSEYKFALIPHCLRDFRPSCQSVPGDIEAVCMGCTEECFINLGSLLLKKYGISPYIAVEMDQERLFRKLKAEHPSIGALGVACIPELVRGMRLCIKLDIPPVGIPLNANRCSRWMKITQESSFSLEELEELIK
jgi:hypothetical protein